MDYANILVRATNWVGDAVMSLPALRAIRTRFQRAQITVLARPSVADIYAREGFRLLSAYTLPQTGAKIWIITEADRSATTVLLPDEY